ncbi:hypothetical protein E2542_SST00277 [Spatholobus suberectus]|nr:hypothetical protein E2542_SST00277 [Spatholobus suberectus]
MTRMDPYRRGSERHKKNGKLRDLDSRRTDGEEESGIAGKRRYRIALRRLRRR